MNTRLLPFILLVFLFPGCLVVSKISYHIIVDKEGHGTALVTFNDIRSDAVGNKEFEEDKINLFDYILKSDDFVSSLKLEGKFVKSRNLKLIEGKLTGIGEYEFNDIEKIEGIRHKDGLYYLTLQNEDSVLTTNGDIVSGPEYKRIIWRDDVRELKFEMESGQLQQKTRDLSKFLKPGK
jgi:hypothetical protein